MKSIGREQELAEVVGRLKTRAETLSRIGPNAVLSVFSPLRGGLSLFLDDVFDELASDTRFLPIHRVLSDSMRCDAEFQAINVELARHLGVPGDVDGREETLIALSENARQQGRLIVLVLDVAKALTDIHERDELRRSTASNRLLACLRVVPNLIKQESACLGLVVGWHDDFLRHMGEWGVQDVVQRYPSVPLWPEFHGGDGVWDVFDRVLQQHGYRSSGRFPGFCRSGLPIGIVLDALQSAKKSDVDGIFLLKLLKREKPWDEARLARCDDHLLAVLCLEDQDLTEADGEPFDIVRSSEYTSFVEPQSGGAYRANSDLYRALGLRPVREIGSFDDRLRRKYEVDGDAAVAGDILMGVRALTSQPLEPAAVIEKDGYALTEVALPKNMIPAECREMIATIYASAASELPPALQADALTELKRIEQDPATRASRMIVFFYRQVGQGQQLATTMYQDAVRQGMELPALPISPKKGAPHGPLSVATMDLSFEEAKGAVLLKLDATRKEDESVIAFSGKVRQGFKRHFQSVEANHKPLRAEFFRYQVLPAFIARAHRWISPAELQQQNPDLRQSQLREILQWLARLEVLTEKDGEYRWMFSKDVFLGRLRSQEGVSASELLKDYFFDPRDWRAVAGSIVDAYSAGLLRFEAGDRIIACDATEFLRGRLDVLRREVQEEVHVLASAGDQANASEHGVRLQTIRTELEACRDVDGVHDLGERLVQMLGEVEHHLQEVEEKRKSLREQLRERVSELKTPHSANVELEKRRTSLIEVAESIDSDAVSVDRLEATIREGDQLIRMLEKEEEHRTTNVKLAGIYFTDVSDFRERLNNIAIGTETSVSCALEERKQQTLGGLERVSEAIGKRPQDHPDCAADARYKQLQEVKAELGRIEAAVRALEREAAASRRPRGPRPGSSSTPPVQPPAEPTQRPGRPPSTTATTPRLPANRQSGPQNRPGEPQPAEGAVRENAPSEIVGQPGIPAPSQSAVAVAKSAASENVEESPQPFSRQPEGFPLDVSQTDQAATDQPTSRDPPRPLAADVGAGVRVSRPEATVTPSFERREYTLAQLDQLADLLRSADTIVKVEIEYDAS